MAPWDVLDLVVKFDGMETPEPTLREMVHKYYSSLDAISPEEVDELVNAFLSPIEWELHFP